MGEIVNLRQETEGRRALNKFDLKTVRDDYIAHYSAQYTVSDLAEWFNLAESTIKGILSKKGMVARARGPLVEVDKLQIEKNRVAIAKQMVKAGFSFSQAAYMLGLAKDMLTDPEAVNEQNKIVKELEEKVNASVRQREADKQAYTETLTEKDKLILEAAKGIESLQKQLDALKEENRKVEAKYQSQVQGLAQEIAELVEKLDLQKEANESFKEQTGEILRRADAEIHSLKSDKQSLQEKEKALEDEKSVLETEVYVASGRECVLEAEIKQLREDIEQLKAIEETEPEVEEEQIEEVEEPVGRKLYEKLYSVEQRVIMCSVYASSGYMLLKSVDVLHDRGIQVSRSHLERILRAEGVYKYKSTARARHYKNKRKNK